MVSQLPGPQRRWTLLVCLRSFPVSSANDPNTNIWLINSVEYGHETIFIFSKNHLRLCVAAGFRPPPAGILGGFHTFLVTSFIKRPSESSLNSSLTYSLTPMRPQGAAGEEVWSRLSRLPSHPRSQVRWFARLEEGLCPSSPAAVR